MKKEGILNVQLSKIIASMGHTDKLVICDCGLPIPNGAEVVDLVLVKHIPTFIDTLRAIMNELIIEGAVMATEIETNNHNLFAEIMNILPAVTVKKVSHDQFKRMTRDDDIIAFVRTGEATPFANIILVSGVNFG